MKTIAHRGYWRGRVEQNSLSALELAFQHRLGVETDLRSHQGRLVLSHDLDLDGSAADFESFVRIAEQYPTCPIFLNIKEDGLLPLLEPYRERLIGLPIVFFDMSVPELVKYSSRFPKKMLCTRVSDHEPIASGANLCDWIWVDGFSRTLSGEEIRKLSSSYPKHSLVFVSPELHGRKHEALWEFLKKQPEQESWMICTDLFDFQPKTGETP